MLDTAISNDDLIIDLNITKRTVGQFAFNSNLNQAISKQYKRNNNINPNYNSRYLDSAVTLQPASKGILHSKHHSSKPSQSQNQLPKINSLDSSKNNNNEYKDIFTNPAENKKGRQTQQSMEAASASGANEGGRHLKSILGTSTIDHMGHSRTSSTGWKNSIKQVNITLNSKFEGGSKNGIQPRRTINQALSRQNPHHQ